ncbi:MAG: glucokinase [Desulfovibrio sp.]|nr:MAG: glucokinase [Desulfovibrio sp.]
MSTGTTRILAADIGGTNSRFALFESEAGHELRMAESIWLQTREATGLKHLLANLDQSDFPASPLDVDMTVIALAGPVQQGKISDPPNIPWAVDLTDPAQDPGTDRFLLTNDFVAQAYACRTPAVAGARELLSGQEDPEGTVAVIGAGTGNGKSALIPDTRGGFLAVPSEGGHSDFPFLTEEEFEYYRFLQKETGYRQITPDIVVTGPGLSHVHKYLTGDTLHPREVSATFDADPDSRTLRWFARFYGRCCRNFAIEVLASGGVFVTGGVAAKSPALVTHPAFAEEFRLYEPDPELMARIPVYLNENEDSGLWGAAMQGMQSLGLLTPAMSKETSP